MRKFMFQIRFRSLLLSSLSYNCHSNPCKPFLSFITSLYNPSLSRAYSSTRKSNPKNSALVDYLIETLKFSKSKALEAANRLPYTKSLQNPEAVVHFFKEIGFSDAQTKSVARGLPSVLFMNVEKTLQPKVTFFQELGLSRTHVSVLISKSPNVLSCSLDRSLKPCICFIIKILKNDGTKRTIEKVNEDLLRIIARCNRLVHVKSVFESNVSYLESCGIVGSQLSGLLVRQTRIFATRENKLRQVVSRALDIGFVTGSRMLVHGVLSCSQISSNTLNKKYILFQNFGFSRNECSEIFRKAPCLLCVSEAKIRRGIELFLHNLMLEKSVLVAWPMCLSLSTEKRLIPRYRVMEMIKSRKLLKREPYISKVLSSTDEKFVENYILSFVNDAEELMAAYEGHLLESSKGISI